MLLLWTDQPALLRYACVRKHVYIYIYTCISTWPLQKPGGEDGLQCESQRVNALPRRQKGVSPSQLLYRKIDARLSRSSFSLPANIVFCCVEECTSVEGES